MDRKMRVYIHKLVPGMVTADDIYTYNDQLIIPKNSVLTDKMITRLRFYSIISISIWEETANAPLEEKYQDYYSDNIKKSKEFQEFQKNFMDRTVELKGLLDTLIIDESSAIDTESVLDSLTKLSENTRNNLHVFDMIHNMRELDDATYVHSINVSIISRVIGKWLSFSKKDLDLLTLCGIFHDIGKLLIPKEILLKPYRLDPSEFDVIKTHAVRGYNLLKNTNLDANVAQTALMHHERCDGSGYPIALTRNQINDYAKVIAIADVYDGMTASRVYRGPLCPFEVIELFESEGLYLYETEYIITFLKNIVNSYMHNDVLLSNGMQGQIVLINRNYLSRPVVKCQDLFMDLSHESNVKIVAVL